MQAPDRSSLWLSFGVPVIDSVAQLSVSWKLVELNLQLYFGVLENTSLISKYSSQNTCAMPTIQAPNTRRSLQRERKSLHVEVSDNLEFPLGW